jgi:hypothetical protein
MAFPERFSNLPNYAFPRLRALLDAHAPGGDPIAMTIGEPKFGLGQKTRLTNALFIFFESEIVIKRAWHVTYLLKSP